MPHAEFPPHTLQHQEPAPSNDRTTYPGEEDGVDAGGDSEFRQELLALRLLGPAVDGVAPEELFVGLLVGWLVGWEVWGLCVRAGGGEESDRASEQMHTDLDTPSNPSHKPNPLLPCFLPYLGIFGKGVDRVGEDDDLVPPLLVVAHQVLAHADLVRVPAEITVSYRGGVMGGCERGCVDVWAAGVTASE